jgi:hypothetical protein
MDLDKAVQAHAEWKIKLRAAIAKRELVDAKQIGVDNQCALGKWLHGDAKAMYGKLPAYAECVARHAAFHAAAGQVAQAINAKAYKEATTMLDAGTPFMNASMAVGVALSNLKKEAKL